MTGSPWPLPGLFWEAGTVVGCWLEFVSNAYHVRSRIISATDQMGVLSQPNNCSYSAPLCRHPALRPSQIVLRLTRARPRTPIQTQASSSRRATIHRCARKTATDGAAAAATGDAMAEPLGGGGGRQRLPALEPGPVLVSACLPCRRGKVRIMCVSGLLGLVFWGPAVVPARDSIAPRAPWACPPPWEAPDPGCGGGLPAAGRALPFQDSGHGKRCGSVGSWRCLRRGAWGWKKALCSLF